MIRLFKYISIRKSGISVIFYFTLILTCNFALCIDHNYNETVFVHFDKEIYFAGDVLHYKAYLLNRNGAFGNNILYFSIYGRNNREELHWRTNVVNNMAYGLYSLPADLPEGIYEVRAYTNSMRCQSSETTFKWRILIMRFTKQATDTLFTTVNEPSVQLVPETIPSGIEMNLSHECIDPGEIVNLSISSNAEDSVFMSLSASIENPFSVLFQNQFINTINTGIDNPSSCSGFSEVNGYILSGTLQQRSTKLPVAGTKIILAVVDSLMPALLYSKTDENGDFYFILNRLYDNRDIIIQTVDDIHNGDLLWVLDDKSLNSHPEIVLFQPKEEQKQFLNKLRELRVIEAVFNNRTDTVIANSGITIHGDFFRNPTKVIEIWDYINLQNFNEIDDNILPSIRFFRQDNRQSLMVFHEAQQRWHGEILLLLNGVPFTDMDYFGLLSSKQLKRLELFASGMIFGGLSYNGVVAAYTYDHVIPDSYLQSKAYIWHNKVISNGYKTISPKQDVDDRIPDFRDHLYFEPDLKIGPGETIHVSFPASMLKGKYRITLNGISDSGHAINLSTHFIIGPGNE